MPQSSSSLSQCLHVPGSVSGKYRGLWLRMWTWVYFFVFSIFSSSPAGLTWRLSILRASCVTRAAVWWLTLELALRGEVRLSLVLRRPRVFCIFCRVSTVCIHSANALWQMDSCARLMLGCSLPQRRESAGKLLPENLFPRIWRATGPWEHLMIEGDQHRVLSFPVPSQTT